MMSVCSMNPFISPILMFHKENSSSTYIFSTQVVFLNISVSTAVRFFRQTIYHSRCLDRVCDDFRSFRSCSHVSEVHLVSRSISILCTSNIVLTGQQYTPDLFQILTRVRRPRPGGGGGDSHMKQTGMLVVSLRGVNFGFWSLLGCSGQSANILSRQGLF